MAESSDLIKLSLHNDEPRAIFTKLSGSLPCDFTSLAADRRQRCFKDFVSLYYQAAERASLSVLDTYTLQWLIYQFIRLSARLLKKQITIKEIHFFAFCKYQLI